MKIHHAIALAAALLLSSGCREACAGALAVLDLAEEVETFWIDAQAACKLDSLRPICAEVEAELARALVNAGVARAAVCSIPECGPPCLAAWEQPTRAEARRARREIERMHKEIQ